MLFLVAIFAVLISPVLMSNSAFLEKSLDSNESDDGSYEDERHKPEVDFLAFIGLWQNVHHGVTDHSPAAQGVKQVDDHLEDLLRDYRFESNDYEGGYEAD
jgi:hypothetical protein